MLVERSLYILHTHYIISNLNTRNNSQKKYLRYRYASVPICKKLKIFNIFMIFV